MAKVNESVSTHDEIPPKWIRNAKDNLEEKLKDDDFRKILDFFVIFTPCKGASARAKPLKEKYRWEDTYGLKKSMRLAPSKQSIFLFAESGKEMKAILVEADLVDNFPSNLEYERGCFYQGSKKQLDSVFSHIRNCFAHGRFSIKEKDGDWTFIFEDVGNGRGVPKGTPSARMILKKSTLLRWIEIIEGGEESLAST